MVSFTNPQLTIGANTYPAAPSWATPAACSASVRVGAETSADHVEPLQFTLVVWLPDSYTAAGWLPAINDAVTLRLDAGPVNINPIRSGHVEGINRVERRNATGNRPAGWFWQITGSDVIRHAGRNMVGVPPRGSEQISDRLAAYAEPTGFSAPPRTYVAPKTTAELSPIMLGAFDVDNQSDLSVLRKIGAAGGRSVIAHPTNNANEIVFTARMVLPRQIMFHPQAAGYPVIIREMAPGLLETEIKRGSIGQDVTQMSNVIKVEGRTEATSDAPAGEDATIIELRNEESITAYGPMSRTIESHALAAAVWQDNYVSAHATRMLEAHAAPWWTLTDAIEIVLDAVPAFRLANEAGTAAGALGALMLAENTHPFGQLLEILYPSDPLLDPFQRVIGVELELGRRQVLRLRTEPSAVAAPLPATIGHLRLSKLPPIPFTPEPGMTGIHRMERTERPISAWNGITIQDTATASISSAEPYEVFE